MKTSLTPPTLKLSDLGRLPGCTESQLKYWLKNDVISTAQAGIGVENHFLFDQASFVVIQIALKMDLIGVKACNYSSSLNEMLEEIRKRTFRSNAKLFCSFDSRHGFAG